MRDIARWLCCIFAALNAFGSLHSFNQMPPQYPIAACYTLAGDHVAASRDCDFDVAALDVRAVCRHRDPRPTFS